MIINYEDFSKLDIRIGKIISAEKIPDADKLLKLTIDIGGEERQVVAGIAKVFENPEILIGKETPILVNLEPRKLRGFESQGMILAASVGDRPVLLCPEEEVPPGSTIK